MCMLCGETQKQGREGMAYRAKQLRELSYSFDALARGHVDPHSKDGESIGIKARAVVRFLVEDWL